MRVADLLIGPDEIEAAGERALPVGFIDLALCLGQTRICRSAFPLIGIGAADHPLADQLDAVIEAPATAGGVARQVMRAPKAAAAAMNLLRSIEGMATLPALVAESICYGMLQGSAEHAAWLATAHRPRALEAGTVALSRDGDLLQIRLNRPDARNAIDCGLRDGLREAFALAAADPDIRGVTLTAEGTAFSVGGDLAEFGTTRDPATAHLLRIRTSPAFAVWPVADRLKAHVQGACIGSGLEIAAFARRLTATPRAWFQLPELAMGLIPGAGGCVSIMRRIGRQRTALMLLSGRRINAATALRWGLVDEITADHDGGDEAGI